MNSSSFLNMAAIGDFDPLSAAIPATKVEITVSCRNLLDRDTFSKSDPSKIIFTFGRTEVIDNTLNPEFVRKFILDYFFEERQNLRFDLRLEKPLGGIPGKKCGTIIVKAEELNNCRESVMMQFCGNKLDKKDFFGKSDPFLVFYRSNEDGTFTICHKTEVVKNTLNPVWQAFKIPVRALCNGDYDRYGILSHNIRHIIILFSKNRYCINLFQQVINPKKKGKKKKYLNSGTVTLLSFLVDIDVTFLDYIKGNPAQPTSLHYMSPYQLNAYAMALKAVGEIIQDYDSDKMFPALGFGAKLPPDGRVSHEFALFILFMLIRLVEIHYQQEKCNVIYNSIYSIVGYAASVKDGSQYFVLLIITDGVISDMAQTKESIVNASCLPMSIIIVGVGPAEFDAMVELDGDEVRISSRGRYAERDIVQFVPFRDYIDRTGNHILSMARLAKDVLAEIPDQFLSYMKTRGIKPSPAPPPYTPPGHPLQTQI
uniref:Copine 8 n=1 Tax=Astyanax mexicanus TaxID=7994 RepID=A0A8B9JBA3_ASTMX